MPDRTRPIRKEISLNEQELSLIRHKMNQLGTRNFGAYARKMLIDGYVIKVDSPSRKSWLPPSAELPQISTTSAAASTAPGISTMPTLPS